MATYRKQRGRWRAEIARRGVRESRVFDSKADAVAWATNREAEILKDARKGHLRGWTVAEALERYARDVSPSKRGARWEAVRLRALARDAALAGKRLRDLAGHDVAAWRDRRLQAVSGASVCREMNLLRSVFEACRRDWGWLHENPMRDVRRPPRPAARDRRVTDEEIERICLSLGWGGGEPENKSQRVAVMFRVAIETGMRAGEMSSLTWPRVHLDRKFVQLDKTKNGTSRRVPLSREAVRLFGLMPRTGATVFNVESGVRDALFRKARDRAEIGDLRFHDSRHEAVTRLARKVDVLDLARIIGHNDLKSLRVYYNATATEIADRLG